MGMPAAGRVLVVRAEAVADVVAADEMQMIGDRRNPLVGELTRLAAPPRLVMSAGNDVKQMRVDAVADESFAVVVPVDAPGIRRAVGIRFPNVPRRMVAVDAAVELRALFVGRARLARQRP